MKISALCIKFIKFNQMLVEEKFNAFVIRWSKRRFKDQTWWAS
jgi:hypothetical protein